MATTAAVPASDILAPFLATERAARDHAVDGERRRSLSPAVVDAAKASGLFCVSLPRELGGLGYRPAEFVEVLERLAYADGAAGWCGFIGNATTFCGWLEPEAARPLLGAAPAASAASVWAPSGRATPDGRGGYVVDGRWTTASGCTHSDSIQLGVVVMDDDGPARRPDGSPDWRFAFVPTDEVEIIDNWDSLGLRGTGSHDVAMVGAQVPAERLSMPLFDPPVSDALLYRLGFWGLVPLYMAPFALGVARRSLDELALYLPLRRTPPGRAPMAEDPQVHYELGRASAALRAARSFLDDAAGRAWATVTAGDPAGPHEHTVLELAMQNAMTSALAAAGTAFRLAGSDVVRNSSVIQRCFRDLHTASKHLGFSLEGYRRPGRRLVAA